MGRGARWSFSTHRGCIAGCNVKAPWNVDDADLSFFSRIIWMKWRMISISHATCSAIRKEGLSPLPSGIFRITLYRVDERRAGDAKYSVHVTICVESLFA